MTLYLRENGWLIQCDFCPNFVEYKGEYADAMALAFDDGWVEGLDTDGLDTHQCPVCLEKPEASDGEG